MGRAAGRARTRRPATAPPADSPQGREIGLDDRDIPSGLPHIVQHETTPAKPAVPKAPPYFRGDMTHGVPAGYEDDWVVPEDREEPGHEAAAHGSQPVRYELPSPGPDPLPVYVVEQREKIPVRREAFMGSITVAAAGGEPTRVCSVDPDRVQVSLLNEDASTVIRFAGSIAALLAGDAAALPAVTNTYKTILTQGELWAQTTSASTAKLSVVIETEVAAG